MATLEFSAKKLQLLIPNATRHTQKKFRRDNISVRPSNIDDIVEAIYKDIAVVASATGITQSLVSLTDTPSAYSGDSNRIVGINSTDDGAEFKNWLISASNLYPGSAGGSVGKSGNGVGKIYFDTTGNLDYEGDLEILTGGTQKAVFKETSGYLGVGVTNPLEPLHSGGGIVIGNATQSSAGTIRYTLGDFQGYDGSSWKSFLSDSSAGCGLTYNTTSNKIDLGGVLNNGSPANNIYFIPSIGANAIRWGISGDPATGDHKVAANADGSNHYYISHFDYWSFTGYYHVIGLFGQGAYGYGSGPQLGCLENQGMNNYLKMYKDVSSMSNADGSLNGFPGGSNALLTFMETDSSTMARRQIWESEGSNTTSIKKQTFDKFEWTVGNAAGYSARQRLGNSYADILLFNADGTQNAMFLMMTGALYWKDGQGLGFTTVPDGTVIGAVATSFGTESRFKVGLGTTDSHFQSGSNSSKRGIKYIGFGETDTETGVDADYTTLVNTSLVPKKYVDDSIAGITVANLFTANLNLLADRNHTLNDKEFKFTFDGGVGGNGGNFRVKSTSIGTYVYDNATPAISTTFQQFPTSLIVTANNTGTLSPSELSVNTNGIIATTSRTDMTLSESGGYASLSAVNGYFRIGDNASSLSFFKNTKYSDVSTNKTGILYHNFGETSETDATGANYSTLVGTSLVPKKYVDDAISSSFVNLSTADLTQAAAARSYNMNNQDLTFSNGLLKITDTTTADIFFVEHSGGDITFGGASGIGTGTSNWTHQTNVNSASTTTWEHRDFGGNVGLQVVNWTTTGGLNQYSTIQYKGGAGQLYILNDAGSIDLGSPNAIRIGYGSSGAAPETLCLTARAGEFKIAGVAAGTGSTVFKDLSGTTAGIEYHADYSTDYSSRSLIDKGYADSTYLTNLSEGTTTTTTVDVNSNTGSNATLAAASTSRAGVMTKAKFDEVVANTAKVGITTAQATKLAGIETSADVTDTTNVVAALTAGTNVTIAGDGTISATGGTASPLTTKGDLYGFDTANQRLGVGTNGQALIANSATATGLEWQNLPGASTGSGTKVLVTGSFAGSGTMQTLAVGQTKIEFDDSVTGGTDVSSEWDNSTHRFTVGASGAGVYIFQASLFVESNPGWGSVHLKKNGTQLSTQNLGVSSHNDSHDNIDGSVAVELAVGDYVEFWANWRTSTGAIKDSWGKEIQTFSITKVGESVTVNTVVLPELTKSMFIPDPIATDDIGIWEPGVAITITKIVVQGVGATSTTFNINHSGGTDLFSSDVVATTSRQVLTSFADATCTAANYIQYQASAISGTPTGLKMTITYTED